MVSPLISFSLLGVFDSELFIDVAPIPLEYRWFRWKIPFRRRLLNRHIHIRDPYAWDESSGS